MISFSKDNKTFQKRNEYYISPLQTVSEEITKKRIPNNSNSIKYIKTYSNLGRNNFSSTILSKNQKNKTNNHFKNKSINLPLLIDKNCISTFYKMKQYKVALPKHREKKEVNEKVEENKVKNLLERYAITSYKNNNKRSISNKNEEKKYDFNSYLKLQSKAEIRFRPRFGDNSLDLVNYINKVSDIRRNVVKDILDEIKNAENRFNVEKPEVDSNFKSKDKNLIDNRWKNSFSLEEYQQFFMKNLKGKISSMNYRQMIKKFRQISLMCFSEGNNNYSSIKRLDYVD